MSGGETAPRVVALPLAPRNLGPEEGVLGRRLAARFAQRLSAAEVPAVVELGSFAGDTGLGFLVSTDMPDDDALAAAGAARGAALVLCGSVGLELDGRAWLEINVVDVVLRRRVIEKAARGVDGASWLQAARDALTALFEHLGVERGLRRPLVEHGVDLPAFVAIARAEDLDAARSLGHGVRDDELLAAYVEAVRAAPGSRETRHALVAVALGVGLGEQARTDDLLSANLREALEGAARLDPDDPRPLLAAGEVALARRDGASAQAVALRVLAREPSHPLAQALAGRAAATLGDEKTAQKYFARYGVSAAPENRRAVDLEIAEWWLLAGRAEAAHRMFAELSQIDPLEVRGLLGLAGSLAALGRLAESSRTAQIALVLAPGGSAERRRARALLDAMEQATAGEPYDLRNTK